MEQLTLQQLFGVNAFQNGQILTIHKSDLPLLTPLSNNTAESLLVALLLTALSAFQGTITDENDNAITNENGTPITYDNQDTYDSLNLFRWKDYFELRNSFLVIRSSIIIDSYTQVDYVDAD